MMNYLKTNIKSQSQSIFNIKISDTLLGNLSSFKETNYEKNVEGHKTLEGHRTLEKEIVKMKEKYPERIAIIVTPIDDKQPTIDKTKYLVLKDMLIGEFVYNIKKRIKINKDQAIFLFIEKEDKLIIPCCSKTVKEYNDNGIIMIKYSLENTFGF